GGGAWAYVARLRAERRTATERVVTQALDEANLLRGQAKAAAVGDLSQWPGAIAAAKQARSLLAAGQPGATLRAKVETMLALLEREQAVAVHRAAEMDRDRIFLERLEAIRLDRFAHGDPSGNEAEKRTDVAYTTAFRDFGIDVDALDPI